MSHYDMMFLIFQVFGPHNMRERQKERKWIKIKGLYCRHRRLVKECKHILRETKKNCELLSGFGGVELKG